MASVRYDDPSNHHSVPGPSLKEAILKVMHVSELYYRGRPAPADFRANVRHATKNSLGPVYSHPPIDYSHPFEFDIRTPLPKR